MIRTTEHSMMARDNLKQLSESEETCDAEHD